MAAAIYLPGVSLLELSAILFVQGVAASCMVLCFAVARENTPAWSAGATLGVVYGFVVGSGAALQPLIGWLLDPGWAGTLVNRPRAYSIAAYPHPLFPLLVTCPPRGLSNPFSPLPPLP